MRVYLFVLVAALWAGAPAMAQDLASISTSFGDGGAEFEGISTRADCTSPHGEFVTEIVSLHDGTVSFVQTHADAATDLLVTAGQAYSRDGATGILVPGGASMESLVRGHDVHRMLLSLDRWFSATGVATEEGCIGMRQANGDSASLCLDEVSGRPIVLEMAIAEEIGGGVVRVEFDDWREVLGVDVPFSVDFVHSGERFTYRFTEVLPFRLAPEVVLPEEPESRFDRLSDLAEIVSVHERALQAHRASDVEMLLADTAEQNVISGRGRLYATNTQESRERLGPYLSSTQFEFYRDTAVPVVAISLDGTLGWLACEIEAKGIQTSPEGESTAVEFAYTWVEMLVGQEGVWRRMGNASSARP